MDSKQRKALEDQIRREAQAMVDRHAPVGEYSARIFGPDGLLRKLWKTKSDRTVLVSSPFYRELRALMDSLEQVQRTDFEADVERASGRLTIVVPKSLHAALRIEAQREGISLSELIRLKLGLPYRLTTQWIAAGTAKPEAA